jgi:transcriptional regulator with XRE-family HTH domain
MATVTKIDLAGGSVASSVARTIKEARALVGWTQRDLASRAGVSQATVCRAEAGSAASLDMILAGRLFTALGLRSQLEVDDFRLDDRRRQQDGLHAMVNGTSARRHEHDGWLTAMEVMIGSDVPYGWIDLLAFRETDRALLVQETKSDIPDMGRLQRSLAFYERSAPGVARALGWDAVSVTVLAVVLDTEAVARRLADHRDLVVRAFPASVRSTAAWLADPCASRPQGWTLATCDPASRSATWLRSTTIGSRRTAPAYRDYADAAARLLRSRPRGF